MRLFVGLELAPSLGESLASLRGSLERAHWLPPQTYHLTLRFIGEIRERHRIEDIDFALSRLSGPSFDLTLQGAGCFHSPGKSGKLWIGIESNAALNALQARIETALQRIGFTAERRRFHPHVTLAGIGNADETFLGLWVQTHNLRRFPTMRVEHFTLFSSHPGPDHPIYEAQADYSLVRSSYFRGCEPIDGAENWSDQIESARE